MAAFMTSNCQDALGSVHISSVRKILSAKARLQGEKRSKVGLLAALFVLHLHAQKQNPLHKRIVRML